MPIPVGIARAMIRAGVAQRVPSIRQLLGDGVRFLRYYNRRILGSPNVELKATQRLLDESPDDLVDLSLGAPSLDPNIARHIDPDALASSGYPPVSGLLALRNAIAAKLSKYNHLHVDPEWEILVCNGVSQGIGLMLDTFVDRGDLVALLDPSFFMYRLAAENRGARVVQIPTSLENGLTRVRDRDLSRSLRNTRVLFINSPANPTGGILAPETLERIAWWCQRRDVLIFSDEVYEHFSYEQAPISIGSFTAAKERTITANSFSKTFGMSAHRIGYLSGPRYLIQPMIVSFLATCPFVNMASQLMAIDAFNHLDHRAALVRAQFAARRDRMALELHRAGFPFQRPAGAFYFWLPVRPLGLSGLEAASQLMAEERVRVMPGHSSGRGGNDFIRISYAGETAVVEEGLRRLTRFVASLQRSTLSLPAPQEQHLSSFSGRTSA